MCFSMEASFAAGVMLLPAGGYCLQAAMRKRRSFLPLAMVPIAFGVQQIAEGFVWLGMEHEHPEYIRPGALVFLFFALAFWPFWFSFLTLVSERQPRKKLIFGLLSVFTTGWFFILYLPILTGPESILKVETVHHSIHYEYPTLGIYETVPIMLLRLLYLSVIALPMALGSESWGRIPGLALAASAVGTILLFDYAFVSVWCFFGAIMSIYLCWLFYWLPKRSMDESIARFS